MWVRRRDREINHLEGTEAEGMAFFNSLNINLFSVSSVVIF
jgi:hypothetical protein